jgi:hypothetical protein
MEGGPVPAGMLTAIVAVATLAAASPSPQPTAGTGGSTLAADVHRFFVLGMVTGAVLLVAGVVGLILTRERKHSP